MKKILSLATLFALVGAVQLDAAPTLRLSSGGDSVTIVDNSADDSDIGGLLGVVNHQGGVGNFGVNVTTGLTKPTFGTEDRPSLDVVGVHMSSGAGVLTVEFTETGFTSPILPSIRSSIGGTTDGSISFDVYVGLNNTEFEQGILVGSVGPLSPTDPNSSSAFAGADLQNLEDIVANAGEYSLTIVLTITHDGMGISSYDAEVAPVPEPATCGLLGLGGLGLLALRRRRMRRSAE